jgi:hypothetical protein
MFIGAKKMFRAKVVQHKTGDETKNVTLRHVSATTVDMEMY